MEEVSSWGDLFHDPDSCLFFCFQIYPDMSNSQCHWHEVFLSPSLLCRDGLCPFKP